MRRFASPFETRKMDGVLCFVLVTIVTGVKCGHGSSGPDLSSDPITVTPAGTIRGSWLFSRRGVPFEAYRGVRYAAPPVGDLRFQVTLEVRLEARIAQAPQARLLIRRSQVQEDACMLELPVKPPQLISIYDGEVNATADGPACPQPTYGDYFVDEDCLRLNVYTPGKNKGPLPVVVFMHAGGFYSISGRSDVAGPNYLLDRELVLVTINYRLASLGFLSTGDALAPGNNGFKDQVMALRWLQKNIAAFGGDPNKVTIAGYSAGSFSVMLHMVSPMSKGLFHRAISMSGSPLSQIELPHHQNHLAVKQAELMNCPTSFSKAILDCLKMKTSKELGDSLGQFFEYAYDPVLIWVPIIENDFHQERFLTEHPLKTIKEGRMHQVPYIISQTQDEFFWKAFSILSNETLTRAMDSEWHRMAPISFYLKPPSREAANTLRTFYLGDHNHGRLVNDSETAASLGKLYNDAIIGFGVHTLANLMAVYSSQPVYYYEFAYIGNSSHYVDPDTNKPTGAAHHDDLIYLFAINATFPYIAESSSLDSRQVDRMTAIWYNFAKYGNPNPMPETPELSFSWPQMTHDKRQYLRIDKEFSVESKLYEDRFQVWEHLYSPKDCEYCTY